MLHLVDARGLPHTVCFFAESGEERMLTSHGWDVKYVEWPNNGLARVGQPHPVPGCPHSDCTYGAARIRVLPSMQGTRVDKMHLATKEYDANPRIDSLWKLA